MKKLGFLATLMLSIMPAMYADIGDVLFPTAVGAGIGGAFGGGKGAGIGAGVGLGLGLMNESSRNRNRYSNDYGYDRPSRYRRGGTYYREPVYQQPLYDRDGNRVYLNYDPMNVD